MKEVLTFGNRQEFRDWLIENSRSSEGVWLKFGKTRKVNTLKAAEALEEALCFGWIDGVMKKIDEDHYLKYFALRRKNSKWSAKNKDLVTALETKGIMTDLGREKIKEAQQTVNGNRQNVLLIFPKNKFKWFANYWHLMDWLMKTLWACLYLFKKPIRELILMQKLRVDGRKGWHGCLAGYGKI